MADRQIAAPVSTELELWLTEPKTVHNSSCCSPLRVRARERVAVNSGLAAT